VNRYNEAMIIGLRHNIDLSCVPTSTKFLALVYYITNYATKLNTPMYERLALAAEVMADTERLGSDANELRKYFLKLANKVFTHRELSGVEVMSYLLKQPTDYTNVKDWTYLYVNSLYWAVWRRWPGLRKLAGCEVEDEGETVRMGSRGRQLNHVEAYAWRGSALRGICLYDYMGFIELVKTCAGAHVFPWETEDPMYARWTQKPRSPGEGATVVVIGNLDDRPDANTEAYFCR